MYIGRFLSIKHELMVINDYLHEDTALDGVVKAKFSQTSLTGGHRKGCEVAN